jgi:diguanylate cyclase (GGDEF)-like protein
LKPFSSILVLIVGFILAASAFASDLVTSRTVLEDVAGTMTIADVVSREGTPVGPTFSKGGADYVLWIRLRVQAPTHGSRVVLFIRPTFLNEIRLYVADPGDPQGWKTHVTGNRYPYSGRDRASISLGFLVDVTTPEATYYLRLKTRGPSSLDFEALEPDEAERKDHKRDLLMAFFVTTMLFLLLWAIHRYFLNRSPVVGLFAVHQAVYTLFAIVTTGYLAPFCPARFPQLADWVNLLLYCGIGFTPVLFCRALFKPYEPPPVLMRGLTLFLWTFPVLVVAIALGHDTFAVNANAVLIKISWLYFVVVAFSLRAESTPRRRLLQVFFLSILTTNLVFWYASRSSWIASKISLSAIQVLVIDGLVIGGLFALILHSRARQMQLEAQQSAVDLLLVQKKLELEKELKKHAQLLAQTDYLTGLFNRRRFIELAERELERAIRFQRPISLLMIDVDHFKKINDTWGHGIGDVVLQKISLLIRDTLRNVDIFGRMGGEEFAAVIVETEGDDAFEIAQRLCVIVANAVIVQPRTGSIQVTVSIGLAQLKGRNIQFNSWLNEADRAMYNAKESGRNRASL